MEQGVAGFVLFMGLFGIEVMRTERVRQRAAEAAPKCGQQLLYSNLGPLGFLLAGVFGSLSKLSIPYRYVALLVAITTLAGQTYVNNRSGLGTRLRRVKRL